MRFTAARLYALAIPFRMDFGHSLQTRAHSSAVVVALDNDRGQTGYGEGAPRPYVTGEDLDSCIAHLRGSLLPKLGGREFPDVCGGAELASLTAEVVNALPVRGGGEVIAYHAAKCALELAIVDNLLQHQGLSAAALWPPVQREVTYSAIIDLSSVDAARALATRCRESGIRQIKIKVGAGDDYARIAAVRDIVGANVSLRLDANGALDLPRALALARAAETLGVDCIEQPFPRHAWVDWVAFRREAPLAVMADESLVTVQDADELLEREACDLFNLRLSKNGGLLATLALAEKGRQAGMGLQLGCQVGETALLSAAGRHFAAHLCDLRYVEGSYGEMLLQEDISREPVRFGVNGVAALLTGPGLGVDIDCARLERYSHACFEVDLSG